MEIEKDPRGRELRTRRCQNVSQLPLKQLFTPHIKRKLKFWLQQRQHHPYPTRREKRILAMQLGLTYIQISNWFANWRRKIKKNVNGESGCWNWSHLTVSCKESTSGNSLSISDADSDDLSPATHEKNEFSDNSIHGDLVESQCFQISSSTDFKRDRSHLLDDTSALLRKWLQSAVNYKPKYKQVRDNDMSFTCYCCHDRDVSIDPGITHQQAELDAAEALTFLSAANGHRKLM